MLIDLVDSRNRPVGKVKRKDVFTVPGGFRTVHVFITNSEGHLLLQQQSRSRDRAPLTWGSSVAAYMFAGESYEEAARRRIQQELGVDDFELEVVGTIKVDDLGHDKFVGLVVGHSEGPFQHDRTHIERLEFVSPRDIDRRIRSGAIAVTPTFKALWRFFKERHGS